MGRFTRTGWSSMASSSAASSTDGSSRPHLLRRRLRGPQGAAGRQAGGGEEAQELRAGPAGVEIGDDHGRLARGLDDRQRVARGAAVGVVVDDDGHDRPSSAGNQCCVRLAKATSDSMTGTSTSTPTTVASAAPEPRPNRLMATATASSKKLGRADHGAGRGHLERDAPGPRRAVGHGEDAVGLDQQRHRDQHDDKRAVEDDLALEPEQQHHRHQEPDDRERLHAGLERIDRPFAAFGDQAPARQIPGQQRAAGT